MVIIKREDVTKQGFCKILLRKLRLRASKVFWVGGTRKGGGRLFEFEFEFEGEGGGLGMDAYSRLGAY